MDDRGSKSLTEDDRALWTSETRDISRMRAAKESGAPSGDRTDLGADSARPFVTPTPKRPRRADHRTKRNRITDADMEAWLAETGDHPENPDDGKNPLPAPRKNSDSNSAAARRPKVRGLPDATAPLPDRFDRKLYMRLAKGQQKVGATLDLHGLTEKGAELRLTTFVRTAHGRGIRNLLVITGKGNRSGLDEFNRPKGGVLRRRVPELLRRSPLSHLVQSFSESHERHGGQGALYVRLRRPRSKTVTS